MTQHTGQSQRQTTEQLRAKEAWKSIEEVETTGTEVADKYGRQARKLPSRIQTNGLAVTIAFLLAKRGERDQKPEFAAMLTHLGNRLQNIHLTENADLMAFIRDASTDQYRRATAELIVYATWLKRFAEAKDLGAGEDD